MDKLILSFGPYEKLCYVSKPNDAIDEELLLGELVEFELILK
jgi:hypothetical protein